MALTVFNDDDQLNIDSFYNNLSVAIKVNKSEMLNLGVYKEGWKFKEAFAHVTTNLALEANLIQKLPNTPFVLYRLVIPDEIINPIPAVSLIVGNAFCGGIHTINGQRYFSFYTAYSGNFDVYIFASNKHNNQTYGLEVYSPQGEVLFDSENKYLRVLGAVDKSKSCALLLQGAVLAQEVPNGYSTTWVDYLWGFIINNSGVIQDVKVYSVTFYGSHNLNNYSRFPKPIYNSTPIIIDVTGY